MATNTGVRNWDWVITSETKGWGWDWKELWSYHQLLLSLIRREFVLYYKQTILGPIWMLLQPALTLLIYVVVFGKLVRLPTGTVPPVLFYLSGIVIWNFFSEGLSGTSKTFQDNIHIFSKVYFPRLILPISVLAVHFLRFLIQFTFFLLIIMCYWIFAEMPFTLNRWAFFLPVVLLLVGCMGLALGLCFSVLTAKYRDLGNLVPTGIRLLMFLTPVIYPIAATPQSLRWLVLWNPLTPLFEAFKFALLGEGTFTVTQLLYSAVCAIILLFIGLIVFNRQGDKLIDVV